MTSSNEFRKSSYSERDNCVEVADLVGGSVVRDSQRPERGHLLFDSTQWRAFLYEVKRDRL